MWPAVSAEGLGPASMYSLPVKRAIDSPLSWLVLFLGGSPDPLAMSRLFACPLRVLMSTLSPSPSRSGSHHSQMSARSLGVPVPDGLVELLGETEPLGLCELLGEAECEGDAEPEGLTLAEVLGEMELDGDVLGDGEGEPDAEALGDTDPLGE